MKMLITEELIQKCIQTLDKETRFNRNLISYEIQDDFNFLLLSIRVDDLSNGTSTEYKSAAKLVDRLVPQRDDEYSWMINFQRDGKIVDSYFGGNSKSPNSGL